VQFWLVDFACTTTNNTVRPLLNLKVALASELYSWHPLHIWDCPILLVEINITPHQLHE
jgi:hypothetical protein